MLSRALVSACTDQIGDELVPRYLRGRDHVWLERVLQEHAAHAGRRKIELERKLRDLDVPGRIRSKLHLVLRVLDRLERTEPDASISPREARAATFRAASRSPADRADVIAGAAFDLGIEPGALEAALFADLKSERRVQPLGTPSPAALAAEANVALATALVARASLVWIRAWGDTAGLARHARRMGLIAVARRGPDASLELEISGPAALFTKTRIYGRALASLLPRLDACQRFELCATVDGTRFLLRSGDPGVAPRELGGSEPSIDQRFARDFARLAPSWQLGLDPGPIETDGLLVFPDFELTHRIEPSRRWVLELVGFWTPSSLRAKLARLEQAGLDRVLLLVDASKACAEGDLPASDRILTHRRRIDPRAVLDRIERG